jgi:hypothetical protein
MAKDGRVEGSVDLALRVEAGISDDDEAAFDVMRRRVTTRVLSQYPHWDYLTELGIELPRELVEIAAQGCQSRESGSPSDAARGRRIDGAGGNSALRAAVGKGSRSTHYW